MSVPSNVLQLPGRLNKNHFSSVSCVNAGTAALVVIKGSGNASCITCLGAGPKDLNSAHGMHLQSVPGKHLWGSKSIMM